MLVMDNLRRAQAIPLTYAQPIFVLLLLREVIILLQYTNFVCYTVHLKSISQKIITNVNCKLHRD